MKSISGFVGTICSPSDPGGLFHRFSNGFTNAIPESDRLAGCPDERLLRLVCCRLFVWPVGDGFGTIYSYTVFFESLRTVFGGSHASTSLLFGVQTLVTFGSAGISGVAIDRYGARPMLAVAAVVLSVGLVYLAFFCAFVPTYAVSVYFVEFARSLGLARWIGIWALSGFGLAGIGIKFRTGPLSNRAGIAPVMAGFAAVMCAATVAVVALPTGVGLLAAAILLGVVGGIVP
ncbi:hypothetical protein [Halovenus sp. HT40]|uniref:hypothetical protein n=1 Tax=Halovenus sp. HT40 TaxID=3126691 RepID=UPI00300E84C2